MNGPQKGLHADIEIHRANFRCRVTLIVEGGVLVLFGPSGAGKTSFLQAVAGLITPQSGDITLDGRTLFRKRPGQADVNIPARARQVGFVYQDYALFPHLTAMANVAYPLWRRPDAKRRALDLLKRLGMEDFGRRYPDELSGGQQQRVAIARALAATPRLLLLDEPFAALDLEIRRQVRSEIRAVLQEAQVPVVLVTHDREEALALGDRTIVLDQGSVVAEGEPVALLGHPPRERVARLLGIENILRLKVLGVDHVEGVTRCALETLRLDVPLSDAREGDEITVGLRADDVLLASAHPQGLSARNVLPGHVVSVEPSGAVYKVVMNCGAPLVSHVTPGAVTELGIKTGAPLWAIVKTSSCFLLQP